MRDDARIDACARALESGQIDAAEAIARELQAEYPQDTVPLNVLGVIANRRGDREAALVHFRAGLALAPKDPLLLFNLAGTLAKLELYDAAEEAYTAALGQGQNDAVLLSGRGFCHLRQARFGAAIDDCRRALSIAPDFADAMLNLAAALQGAGRTDEALAAYRRASELAPHSTDAGFQLGLALQDANDHVGAMDVLRRVLAISPDHVDALVHLGVSLHVLRRYDEAIEYAEAAIACQPELAVAHSNKALALHLLFRDAEAVVCFDRAIALAPDDAAILGDRGFSKFCLGDYAGAESDYRSSLALDPDRVLTRLNHSLCLLLQGRLVEGFSAYDWRWRLSDRSPLPAARSLPLWQREAGPKGQTILLHAEQGFGDTIQFSRYAPLVAHSGARVILQVQNALVPLLRCLPDVAVVLGESETPPPCDAQAGLMDLPRIFGTDLSSIPRPDAYLVPPAASRAKWRQNSRARGRPRVGVAWRGSTIHARDKLRSIDFEAFSSLFDAPCAFHLLQPETPESVHPNLTTYGARLADFADTAALCETMDLVVAVDTSVAHLAGALGKPVWILLPFVPDWRWLLDREDTPWYASAKLYRQIALDDWDTVLQKVREDLKVWATKIAGE